MSRLLLAALVFLAVLLDADMAWAQEAATQGNPPDTFPASLGYAAIAAISTAGATMSTVIAALWKSQRNQDKTHTEQLAGLRVDHLKAVQAAKDECRVETDKMRDRLEQEQKERREEAERLLREQKEIMREVMVTSSAISQSFAKLEATIQQWGDGE